MFNVTTTKSHTNGQVDGVNSLYELACRGVRSATGHCAHVCACNEFLPTYLFGRQTEHMPDDVVELPTIEAPGLIDVDACKQFVKLDAACDALCRLVCCWS